MKILLPSSLLPPPRWGSLLLLIVFSFLFLIRRAHSEKLGPPTRTTFFSPGAAFVRAPTASRGQGRRMHPCHGRSGLRPQRSPIRTTATGQHAIQPSSTRLFQQASPAGEDTDTQQTQPQQIPAPDTTTTTTTTTAQPPPKVLPQDGLYRPIFEQVWQALKDVGCQNVELKKVWSYQETAAKGMPEGTRVTIATSAMTGGNDSNGIQYARAALLETLPPWNTSSSKESSSENRPPPLATAGIQVLNLVVFPRTPQLPVWGADLVSLPGNKHLWLLDVQPMVNGTTLEAWQEWYTTHKIDTQFPWGGDLPAAVQPYVSPHALWTRIAGENATERVPDTVQGPLQQATLEHLQIYLDLLQQQQGSVVVDAGGDERPFAAQQPLDQLDHHRDAYLQYRFENDPARPMLTRLFGEEWTETVLQRVLFPPL